MHESDDVTLHGASRLPLCPQVVSGHSGFSETTCTLVTTYHDYATRAAGERVAITMRQLKEPFVNGIAFCHRISDTFAAIHAGGAIL